MLSQAGLVALGLLPHFWFQSVLFLALLTEVGVKVGSRVTDVRARTLTCIFLATLHSMWDFGSLTRA